MNIDIDPIEKAGLITRTVDTVDRDGKPAKRLTAARSYPTSIEDLWDTVTNVERIPRWFMPITGDLHVGGRFQLEGNAAGEVLACEPPRRFEITWEYGGEVSWVTVEFSGDPGGDQADLVLQHVAHVPDEMWDQFGPGAVGIGWDLGLMGLDLHITTGEAVSPEDVQSWDATPDAADFKSRSSTAWAEASIASGTDRADALASAERVTAFYTATE
jgi:uncharacterized protein YndB with AHSA1/START domain